MTIKTSLINPKRALFSCALATGLALTCGVAAGTGTAQAAESGVEDGTYYIAASNSPRQVLDVSGGSRDNAANVQVYEANQTSAQKWSIENTGDGYVMLRNGSGKVLDVAGAQRSNGTNVWQYDRNGTDAQKFKVVKNSDGTYTFKSALDSNLVLDLAGGQTGNCTNLQVYSSNGTNAQKFNLYNLSPVDVSSGVEIEDGYYCIQSKVNSNYYMDLDAGKSANGTNIQVWSGTPGTNNNQIFYIEKDEQGFYIITNCATKKALDVSGNCVLPGSNIQQYASNGTDAQKWNFIENSDGSITLQNKGTGLVADISAGQARCGQNIQGYLNNGTNAQKWQLVETTPVHEHTWVAQTEQKWVVDVEAHEEPKVTESEEVTYVQGMKGHEVNIEWIKIPEQGHYETVITGYVCDCGACK